jgi:hypothetical protein
MLTSSNTNWESRFVKVRHIVVINALFVLTLTKIHKMIINIFNYMRC